MELRYLSQASGDQKYAGHANKIYSFFYKAFQTHGGTTRGLLPVYADVGHGGLNGELSFGGGGDSYYEYLIKTWIQASL